MKLVSYRNVIGTIQSLVFASPLIAILFDNRSAVPFPPLGDDVLAWRFFAAVIVGTAILVPFLWRHAKYKSLLATLFVTLLVVSTVTYLMLQANYVLPITYADGHIRFVTRGTIRSPELKEPYKSMTDEELIRSSGQSDLRLRHIYSATSLQANRLKLFGSYLLSLYLFDLFLGTIATLDDKNSGSQST